MGQSVSQQLGAGALGYGVDPDYVRSQILQQREKGLQAITNPQQQLAARLGGMLGGGLVNVANDRGFFEVTDPLLTKVTQIQGIYNQVAQQIDPASNPEQFFTALQTAYKDAGMGQQALMAAQEAQKYQKEGIALQASQYELFNKNPELLDKEIAKAEKAGDTEKVAQLEAVKTRAAEARQLDRDYKKAQISSLDAQAAAAKATAAGKDIVYVPDIVTGKNMPYERKDGKLVPLAIEGGSAIPGAGSNKGKKMVYNMETGRVEYK